MWLANVRGTTWGLHHATLATGDSAFWEFTWDDMAATDLPAMCGLAWHACSHVFLWRLALLWCTRGAVTASV